MLFNFDMYRKKVRGCYVGKCVGEEKCGNTILQIMRLMNMR